MSHPSHHSLYNVLYGQNCLNVNSRFFQGIGWARKSFFETILPNCVALNPWHSFTVAKDKPSLSLYTVSVMGVFLQAELLLYLVWAGTFIAFALLREVCTTSSVSNRAS